MWGPSQSETVEGNRVNQRYWSRIPFQRRLTCGRMKLESKNPIRGGPCVGSRSREASSYSDSASKQ